MFTSKQFDSDIELYYFNARWYDPEIGRFVSEDPIRDSQNWYAYCRNNPLKFIDPTGLLSDSQSTGISNVGQNVANAGKNAGAGGNGYGSFQHAIARAMRTQTPNSSKPNLDKKLPRKSPLPDPFPNAINMPDDVKEGVKAEQEFSLFTRALKVKDEAHRNAERNKKIAEYWDDYATAYDYDYLESLPYDDELNPNPFRNLNRKETKKAISDFIGFLSLTEWGETKEGQEVIGILTQMNKFGLISFKDLGYKDVDIDGMRQGRRYDNIFGLQAIQIDPDVPAMQIPGLLAHEGVHALDHAKGVTFSAYSEYRAYAIQHQVNVSLIPGYTGEQRSFSWLSQQIEYQGYFTGLDFNEAFGLNQYSFQWGYYDSISK